MTVGPSGTPVGTLVGGKYRIGRLLAKGGMGVVYEAHHAVVRRRFAIKFLRRDLAERRDILSRFQREAEAAGALENENVAAAVDFGISDDGVPYIVMEYLVGESLGALLEREGCLPRTTRRRSGGSGVPRRRRGARRRHRPPRSQAAQPVLVPVATTAPIWSRCSTSASPSCSASTTPGASTRTGTVLGTAAYMSPEQARGEKLVDLRADVYALGAILYELLSRQMPHPGDSQNAILHHIATQPRCRWRRCRRGWPPSWSTWWGARSRSDPGARPQTAAALALELAPFARREVWPGRPASDSGAHANPLASTMAAGEAGEPAASAGESTGGPIARRSRRFRQCGPLAGGRALR